MKQVIVNGGFDDLRFADFRFLEEASKLGPVEVRLWSDQTFRAVAGHDPKFPQAEREYFLRAIRYVDDIKIMPDARQPGDLVPAFDNPARQIWVSREMADRSAMRQRAAAMRVEYRTIGEAVLKEAPDAPTAPDDPQSGRKKVIVTGCYDWFHSGHVRFFEECSELGDLYAIVGHDDNIRLLKGEGHPLFPATVRRYIAGAIRYTTMALISTGNGWLDAEPEIERIKPDIYAVNEDGDRPEKRTYCESHGIEYKVLKRLPKPGLTKRQSTVLRGF